MLLYWLRVEQNIAHPGSHASLAFLFNNDLALFGTGTILSLVACAAAHAWAHRRGASLRLDLTDAARSSAAVTLLVALFALPVALILALNLWGS